MMRYLYNLGIWCYTAAIAIAATVDHKARLWYNGRKGIMKHIEKSLATHATKPRIWIHAASLGEFEQARPIIERLRQEHLNVEIIVTLFSPSGYEIRKDFPLADAIFYLPADTPNNAQQFLDIVNPTIAIFIKYEYWLNYLRELRKRKITTFLISALFREDSIFFKPWGGMWREALSTYSTIFVQNKNSRQLLKTIDIEHVMVAGDTRFDRVMSIANSKKQIPVIESFRGDRDLLVAGSTWSKDEQLVVALANDNRDIKIVIAPHEIDSMHVRNIMDRCEGGAIRYTECNADTKVENYQVLILDTMGMLATAYRYAKWAYVGGGFGAGIHNTLEPAVYGLPIAFGPRYEKFHEAREMITRGVAHSISSYDELRRWFVPLREDSDIWQHAHDAAMEYTSASCGATERIVEEICYKGELL